MGLMLSGMYSKFIPVTEKKMSSPTDILRIGSCGLHVLYGALGTGLMETDWEINKVLHAT